MKAFYMAVLILLLCFSFFADSDSFAGMPNQDNTAIGTAYDGVDFDTLLNGRIYFGAMKQAVSFQGVFYGDVTKAREQYPTPVLWRSIGEDGIQDGSVKDGAIALFSEYVIDAMKFSASGRQVYAEWAGEADYDASFICGWLNAEGQYTRGSMSALGFGDSFKITEDDGTIRYDAELDAIVRSTVSTYFIAQATQADSELVLTNPGDVYLYSPGSMGEWTSYFGSSATPFDSWPVVQADVLAYLPFGVRSYAAWPSNYRVFYNATGLPMTATSEDYSIGTPGSNIYKGVSKYGLGVAYWMRNPIGLVSDSGSTRPYTVSPGGTVRAYETACDGSGIRPITKLDPESIVMTHELIDAPPTLTNQLQADKSGGTEWNYEAVGNGLSNHKLTLRSSKVSLNHLESAGGEALTVGDAITINASGTATVKSSNYIGDYLAYKIVGTSSNGGREIVGYGTSKGATPDVLEIKTLQNTIDNDVLAPGNYHIYIWAQGEDTEGANGTSVHSFEASNLMNFELAVQEPMYELTYDPNTADVVTNMPNPTQETYQPGAVVAISPNEPVRDGYRFLGWNTEADGSGLWYAITGTDSFIITGNIVLYAQWEENVVFDLTLTKIVTGRYGNQSKKFEITITLKDAGIPVSGKYMTHVDGINGDIMFDGNGEAILSLAHNEAITIFEIPAEYTVNVTETDYSLSGYVTSYRSENLVMDQGDYTYNDTRSGTALVEITNKAMDIVPTAVRLNTDAAALVSIALAAGGFCVWLMRKRRSKKS